MLSFCNRKNFSKSNSTYNLEKSILDSTFSLETISINGLHWKLKINEYMILKQGNRAFERSSESSFLASVSSRSMVEGIRASLFTIYVFIAIFVQP